MMTRTIFLSLACAAATFAQEAFLLRGATIHPVTGPDMTNAMMLVQDGKIAEIAPVIKPTKGLKIVDAKGLHVYPGFINAATVIGISEVASVRETNDTNEIGEFVPAARAIVAVNPESDHIPVVRVNGITSVVTLPATVGSGGGGGGGFGGAGASSLIRGQAALIHMDGWTWEEMAIRTSIGVLMRFPVIQTRSVDFDTFTVTNRPYTEVKRQYDAEIRKIDEFFERARRYQRAKLANSPEWRLDTQLEAMLPVFDGKMPLLVPAQRERTIREAIEFADKHKVKLVLLDVRKPGAMLKTIAEKKIPVVVGQPTELPLDDDDAYDSQFTLPAELHKAGVKFAFATFANQFARNLPFEAGFAVAYGLPMEAALKALTIDAAEIFGASNVTGSLEKGKWADFIVTDGDPLEIRTQVKMLYIKGKNISLETKHTRLYQKYLNRP